MFNWGGGGGLPSAFVNGRWWIRIVVVGGSGRSSMVALDLRGRMLAVVDGSDGDSSPFSQVGVVSLCPQAIDGVCGHWLCFFEGILGQASLRMGACEWL
jgi:hypothetical protein